MLGDERTNEFMAHFLVPVGSKRSASIKKCHKKVLLIFFVTFLATPLIINTPTPGNYEL